MKHYKTALFGSLLYLTSFSLHADTQAVEGALKKILPNVKPDSITASPLTGLYEVAIGPKLLYISEDGRYLIHGALIDANTRENITEKKESEARVSSLKKIGTDKMIVFSPKIHQYVAYVFTDIDCGYCRKLHSEIDQYLKEGIEIRYLFFPRTGEGSDSWLKAVSVWCAKDRNAAFTKAKRGENLERKDCDNPVAEHFALGSDMGANGTPMIVTENGTILGGYVPATQLSKILKQESGKTNANNPEPHN